MISFLFCTTVLSWLNDEIKQLLISCFKGLHHSNEKSCKSWDRVLHWDINLLVDRLIFVGKLCKIGQKDIWRRSLEVSGWYCNELLGVFPPSQVLLQSRDVYFPFFTVYASNSDPREIIPREIFVCQIVVPAKQPLGAGEKCANHISALFRCSHVIAGS